MTADVSTATVHGSRGRRWEIRWRPRVIRCCPGRPLLRIGCDDTPPLVWTDPRTDREWPSPQIAQCPGCGQAWAADVVSIEGPLP